MTSQKRRTGAGARADRPAAERRWTWRWRRRLCGAIRGSGARLGGAGRGGEVGSGGTARGPIEKRCGRLRRAPRTSGTIARTMVASAYFLCRPMRFSPRARGSARSSSSDASGPSPRSAPTSVAASGCTFGPTGRDPTPRFASPSGAARRRHRPWCARKRCVEMERTRTRRSRARAVEEVARAGAPARHPRVPRQRFLPAWITFSSRGRGGRPARALIGAPPDRFANFLAPRPRVVQQISPRGPVGSHGRSSTGVATMAGYLRVEVHLVDADAIKPGDARLSVADASPSDRDEHRPRVPSPLTWSPAPRCVARRAGSRPASWSAAGSAPAASSRAPPTARPGTSGRVAGASRAPPRHPRVGPR